MTLVEYDDNLVVSPNIERKIIIELRNYTEKRIEIFQTNNEDLQKYRIKISWKRKENTSKMAQQMEVGVQDFVLLDEVTLEKFMENLHKR